MKTLSQRSSNSQLAVNMLSGVVVFVIGLCISFFLTPYIVEKLGAAAYGFIGLSTNIIGYSGLITIAINSMAGRFITLRVHAGDIHGANVYMSSVFYVNLLFALIILAAVCISAVWLENIIHIPADLINDVKTLYVMLGVSSGLSLMTGVISVGAFIRNRLDITNVREFIGNVIRVVLLLLLFGLCTPRLWYFGITALVMAAYMAASNYYFFRLLTPELVIKHALFSWKSLVEIAASGVWNIVNKISNLLTRGCELLLANLFVSARAMGLLSIALTLPGLILNFFGAIARNFSPELTRYFARGEIELMKNDLFKAVRICGFLSAIPMAWMYAFGDVFFTLWMPGQDITMLYLLSIVGSVELVFGLPIEPLWNIFVITDRVRRTSTYQLILAIVTFGAIIGSMYITSDETLRLLLIAGIHSVLCVYRNLTFVPRFGAKCLGLAKSTFYPLILKNLLNFSVITAIGFICKQFMLNPVAENSNSWLRLICASVIFAIAGIIVSNFIIIRKSERDAILHKIGIKKTSPSS